MRLHHTRQGHGPPLLLVHGLGSTSESWAPILDDLATQREVIAVDLPGHGRTPPLRHGNTVSGFVESLEEFLRDEQLQGVDLVGSSLGGRLVLELARRGSTGAVVALDPGGFWGSIGARYLGFTLSASVRLLRALRPVLGAIAGNAVARTILLVQLSPRPWALDRAAVLHELQSFAGTTVFMEVLDDLVHGPPQAGIRDASREAPITIVWGRRDRVTLTGQAKRAARRFPDARISWLERCGHYPHWDRPDATVRLILAATRHAVDDPQRR